jgi:SsrA-binding protein
MAKKTAAQKALASNRKARHLYTTVDSLETGIELTGTEVKSMKASRFSYSDSYAAIENGELWIIGLHISPYDFGNISNHEPLRKRKLLVHRQEIKRLKRQVEEKGLTLIPLRFYLKRGLVKLELGICRGKKLYDRREAIKKRDQNREEEREFRHRF